MFYNLLISGDNEAWEGNSYIIDPIRCIKESEYTLKEIADKYVKLGNEEINELKTFPCIFAYENYCDKDPSFGYITDIIVRRDGIKISFEKITMSKFLSKQDMNDFRFELDIGEWEFNRTHWAIKDVELDKLLLGYAIDLRPFMINSRKPINISTYNFDVSFTFAGESRDYVKSTVFELQKLIDINRIFYDDNYISQLARPSIDILLQDIYRNRSKLVVVFLCEKYQEKEWCGVEFRAIREIIKEKDHEKIMFIRLDNGHVDGIFSTDGYIDGRTHSPREVANFINQRIYLQSENLSKGSVVNKFMIQDIEADLINLRNLLKESNSLIYDIKNEDFVCPFNIDVFTKFDISLNVCNYINFNDNDLESYKNDYLKNIAELVSFISEYTRPTANAHMAVLKRIGPGEEVEGDYSDFDIIKNKMLKLRERAYENFGRLKEYEKTLKENIKLLNSI